MASKASKKSRCGPSALPPSPPPQPEANHPCPASLDSFGPEIVDEILLRLQSHAPLARAALASKRYLRAACAPGIRRRFLALHPSASSATSPAPTGSRPPSRSRRHPAPLRDDRHLAGVAAGSCDFLLYRFNERRWRVHDCLDGLLLLTTRSGNPQPFTAFDDGGITIFNPVSLRLESVRYPNPPPSPVYYSPGARGVLYNLCLLPKNNSSTPGFRIAAIQKHRTRLMIRLVVYNSRAGQWSFNSWVRMSLPEEIGSSCYYPPMHACRFVYFKYRNEDKILRLDSITMRLSDFALPPDVPMCMPWCIGETENREHCLVCVVRVANQDELGLWIHDDSRRVWELRQQKPLWPIEGVQKRVREVCAMVDGIVTLSLEGSQNFSCPHVALTFSTLELKSEFVCGGLSFPYIMPWLRYYEGMTFNMLFN